MYIPPDFATVAPYFFVENAEKFVHFLVKGLGGAETCRTARSDGKIANVIVRLGTGSVMVSEATEQYPPMRAAYYLYVEHADASVQQALLHGAELEMPVADMPYHDRQGGVRDR
jgi:PhnB protein